MFAFLGCEKERKKNNKDVLKFCLSLSSVFSGSVIFLCPSLPRLLKCMLLNHFDKNLAVLLFVCFFSESQLFYYLACLPFNDQIRVITVHTIQPGRKHFCNNHDKF